VVNSPIDPVIAQRARIARSVKIAQRIGYTALLVAMAAFAVGIASDFPGWSVVLTVAGLAAAIIILPIPIVLGYGVRAAEREERQAQNGGG